MSTFKDEVLLFLNNPGYYRYMLTFKEEVLLFFNNPDPRVAKWPLMDTPVTTIALVIGYLIFVKLVGPSLMRNRKPFDLRLIMTVYNFSQVVVSSWIFMNLGMLGWFTKYSWRCEPIDFSYNKDAIRIAEVCWVCFLLKFYEFLDTVFFVLRKKNSQITTLHVFHHALVPITVWIGIKYGAGGYNTLFPVLNSFVHAWMYLYYGLAALGPSVQKYLWWKKYLTKLQMLQFILVLVFMLQLYFYPTCEVSKVILLINLLKAAIFFIMFMNFYRTSYKTKKKSLKININIKLE
ncbi:elongation of very long chain fatty acids protein AAEL008004 [Caerostris darwini]|uniref:Elongation of very long chain fatty acids protein n=1 Tax=Caerostris darwini TaxID=1538125 RepID=A0AAV4T3P6_9ARAC|nr:elongation of very long chain fatty acids protein AAEL008004 [Caerostris darwini]